MRINAVHYADLLSLLHGNGQPPACQTDNETASQPPACQTDNETASQPLCRARRRPGLASLHRLPCPCVSEHTIPGRGMQTPKRRPAYHGTQHVRQGRREGGERDLDKDEIMERGHSADISFLQGTNQVVRVRSHSVEHLLLSCNTLPLSFSLCLSLSFVLSFCACVCVCVCECVCVFLLLLAPALSNRCLSFTPQSLL